MLQSWHPLFGVYIDIYIYNIYNQIQHKHASHLTFSIQCPPPQVYFPMFVDEILPSNHHFLSSESPNPPPLLLQDLSNTTPPFLSVSPVQTKSQKVTMDVKKHKDIRLTSSGAVVVYDLHLRQR